MVCLEPGFPIDPPLSQLIGGDENSPGGVWRALACILFATEAKRWCAVVLCFVPFVVVFV